MGESKTINTKDYRIETLRGIAILLVVMGHVIGSAPDGGMKIDFPSPWRYLYLWIDYIQMPLFTAIAGWVYALKPIQKQKTVYFIKNKVLRLLVPMFFVGTLYFLVQYAIPGTNSKGTLSEIWKIYIFPYTIYWYLPALFLIFIITINADLHKYMSSIYKWISFLTLSYILMMANKMTLFEDIPNLFSFKGALGQLPYFILGVGIQRFHFFFSTKSCKYICIFIAIIGIILLQFEWFYPLYKNNWYEYLKPFLVICTLVLIFKSTYTNNFFIWIGSYAYTIYLFHVFGTSGGRIILKSLGTHSELLIFIVSLTIAVFAPILVEKIFIRWKVTRVLFLGKK